MSSKDCDVTIICPVYNAAAYLKETLDSVIAQTYPNWELLVVDDCSTDESFAIATECAKTDPRVRAIRLPRNTGSPVAPRNHGLSLARGRYVAFIDSDDVWLPSKLDEQLAWFSDEKVAIVYSDYEKIASDGVRSGRVVRNPPWTNYARLLNGNVILQSSGIYDRTRVGEMSCLDVHFEDYAFWLSILKRGWKAANTCTVLALYRLHDDSVSGNKLRAAVWTYRIYRDVERLSFLSRLYHFVRYAIYASCKRMR